MNALTALRKALRFVGEILSAEKRASPVDVVLVPEFLKLLDDPNVPPLSIDDNAIVRTLTRFADPSSAWSTLRNGRPLGCETTLHNLLHADMPLDLSCSA